MIKFSEKKGVKLVKIVFELKKTDWHNSLSESVWAEEKGNGLYRMDNVPFYAYGVSYNDLIEAKVNKNGELIFRQVVEHSGHSTYRFFVNKGIDRGKFNEYWEKLEKHGCTYEKGFGTLYAVDVPPQANIEEVYKILEEGEKKGIWGFEEAHFGRVK